jgi:hypothetical protein
MLNTQTLLAVGDFGRFIKSSDGGAMWTVRSIGNYALLSISCTDANTCTAVGNVNNDIHGIILRTTDGGVTWVQQFSEGNTWLNSVFCTGANTCTAVGRYGGILRTAANQ